ncbi:odorant receptor 2a-like [Leptinotarsa decemlineata]|uniref:odorant receptor 2a-like n=1 Tax=Leptinotarsa decemlineata TaxID=7539 RepID=UPI003D30A4D2
MLDFIFLTHSGLSLFITCCLSYTASKAESFEMPHLMMMTSVVLIEVFTSCWFCYDFSLEFSNTRQAFYELDWPNYPPKLRRTIIFTLARLENPPFFTMWKWTKIDILFFFNFLKMVYSFYTLISKAK